MGELDIGCSGCSYRETFSSWSAGHYVLATSFDGEDCSASYDVGGRNAWCNAEGRLTIAEKLPTVEQLVAELDDLERNGRDELDEVTGMVRSIARRVHHARVTVAWRRARTTPERCLRCGSEDLVEGGDLWKEGTKFPHPGCTANGLLVVHSLTIIGEFGGYGEIGPDGLRLSDAPRERVRDD